MEKVIKCKVLKDGQLPVKAHATDAGYDLFATEDFTVEPGQIVKHPLNIKLELPDSSYAEITSKSEDKLYLTSLCFTNNKRKKGTIFSQTSITNRHSNNKFVKNDSQQRIST